MPFNTNVGGVLQSQATQSYNSFAGADITAVIGGFQFAQLQAISYSITREKAPIYTMGSPDVRSFSRNKRGIAGSMIWVNFDRDSLLSVVYSLGGKFIANSDDVRPAFRSDTLLQADQTAIFSSSLVRDTGPDVSGTIDQLDSLPVSEVSSLKEAALPWYTDQILPFDVTLAGTNEMGAATAMRIFGIEILNTGNGTSIDDTVNESQATFVARFVEPWQAVATPDWGVGLGGDSLNS